MTLRILYNAGLLALLVTMSNSVIAKSIAPKECNYLKSVGLPTNAYHQLDGEKDYICLADYLEVGAMDKTGSESTLDFSVEGTATTINNVILRAMYSNQSSNEQARKKFIKASTTLVSKITGKPMPAKLLAAMKNGKATKQTISGKTVNLEVNPRYNYANGKSKGYGYTHILTISY